MVKNCEFNILHNIWRDKYYIGIQYLISHVFWQNLCVGHIHHCISQLNFAVSLTQQPAGNKLHYKVVVLSFPWFFLSISQHRPHIDPFPLILSQALRQSDSFNRLFNNGLALNEALFSLDEIPVLCLKHPFDLLFASIDCGIFPRRPETKITDQL